MISAVFIAILGIALNSLIFLSFLGSKASYSFSSAIGTLALYTLYSNIVMFSLLYIFLTLEKVKAFSKRFMASPTKAWLSFSVTFSAIIWLASPLKFYSIGFLLSIIPTALSCGWALILFGVLQDYLRTKNWESSSNTEAPTPF